MTDQVVEIMRLAIEWKNALYPTKRDQWLDRFESALRKFGTMMHEQMERAERAEAEAAALRKLLEPLAALAQPHNERIADDIPLFSINGKAITAGDARAAKAALAAKGNE